MGKGETVDDVLTDGQLATLSRGRIMKTVDDAIEECMRHCLNNPGITKERELVLRLKFKPLMEEGEPSVNIGSSVNKTLPGNRGPSDRAVYRDGKFKVFSVPGTVERQMDVVDFAAKAAARNGD